jgi:hypothetical protein
VSIFYVLPPRPFLGERLTSFLKPMFPGLDWSSRRWSELAESVAAILFQQPDVYVVHRDELPADGDWNGRIDRTSIAGSVAMLPAVDDSLSLPSFAGPRLG